MKSYQDSVGVWTVGCGTARELPEQSDWPLNIDWPLHPLPNVQASVTPRLPP
ncbi:hypothetical protein [Pseudomonas sp. Root329]|uniref:hypothetical protein n=1 Tax=Pseudomonas sp. Root329 TaxID=1736515 RepID=UPI003FA68D20